MKKKFAKSIIIVLAIVATILACTLAIIASNENKSYTVTYYSNGNVAKVYTVEAGGKHDLATKPFATEQTGKQLFGWYDETGKLYPNNGLRLTVNQNYTFYEAYGSNVKSEADFIKGVKQAGNYVKLGASIALDEVVALPTNGLVIIDLNGYSLTVTSKDVAFTGTNAGIHILNTSSSGIGKILHTGEVSSADLMDAALFTLTPNLKKNVDVHLFKNTNIETNVGLFDIVSDLTYSKYTYSFSVDGSVTANFLVRTYGIKNAAFKTNDTTALNVTGQYAFEDRGNYDGINLTFDMPAGKLDMIDTAFVTNELSKYNVFLTGGSYNRDLSKLYSNYTFTKGTDERYTIASCKHNDVAIGMTATCTEAGEITYKCSLCGLVHTVASNALGHSVYKELTQEAITTKEKTEPGYYTTTCMRCDYEEREYFYPSAKDTYVTVKYRKDGIEKTIRVKSTLIFGDDIAESLNTFSTTYIEFENGIKQSDIYSLEIPLGIKTIKGGYDEDGRPQGLFYGNSHLEEIILPMSIENIEATVFADMPKLRTVTGIEYITGKIGNSAFQQTKGNTIYIERMEINANSIGANAFENFTMLSLTFGENVKSISNYAFALGSGKECLLKEIFIEGNPSTAYDGARLSKYNEYYKCFTSLGSGHQFDYLPIVFFDHKFDVETVAPTCQAKGYDFMKCEHCGEEKIDNYTSIIDHNYVTIDPPVQSTCSTQGYEGTKCTMCDSVRVTKYYPYNENNHDYTYSSKNSLENICEYDYHIIGVCMCGKSDPNAANWIFQKATGKHTWDEQNPIEYVEPTCGVDGYKTFSCIHCGYEVSEIYKATGKHMYVSDNKNTVPATCTQDGKKVMVCDECSAIKEIDLPKDPKNHEWEKDENGNLVWTVKVAATAEKAGTAQNKCVGCGETQTKGIPVTSEETKGISTLLLVILIVGGSILVLGGVGLTLYFTVFKKSASSGYKYKFNTLGKK
ncbi:MAG: leucine-rich repeat protein [Clostridia bacterium]|nr:leucine-rich repeat protein [Clostridia bacterium]